MKPKLLERHALGAFLAISAIAFVVGLSAMLVLWLTLKLLGLNTSLWSMIEALSTAVAAAAVLGAAFVASRELNELAISRHMEVADRLFSELNSPENVAARRWIFHNLPDDPKAGICSMHPDGRDAVKLVLNSLDRVAFLTKTGWIPDDLIMSWMNPMVVKSWEKLGPYVDYESSRRNEPDYYAAVRELGERCLAWRQKNLGYNTIYWIDDAL